MSWRNSRFCPAPRAARTANSLRRCAPRAKSRLVTFMVAIRSTRITAPKIARRAGFTPAMRLSCKDVTITPSGTPPAPSKPLAWALPKGGRSVSSSLAPCFLLMPAFNRATICKWWPHSLPSSGSEESYCSGAHSSALGARTFSKLADITPMTVYLLVASKSRLVSSVIALPTTLGSAAKRRRHRRLLKIKTFGP